MLISKHQWEKARHHFTEEEKESLALAVTGEAICPAGNIVDENQLPADLRQKVEFHFGKEKARSAS